MTDRRNDKFLGVDYYLTQARIERAKATRRFFRRLVGRVDKADTNTWG